MLHVTRKAALRPVAIVLAVVGLVACGGGDGDGGGGGDPPPVADTTPPTAPGNLTATAASPTTVRLEWTASTDAGTGVAGYRVYRDGSAEPVATVATTSYDDAALAPGTTYAYAVRAYDAAVPSNVSPASATVSVSTPADVPEELVLSTERAFPALPAFVDPVLALQAPDDGSTWYVVEQEGRVRAFANEATVGSARSFIDLRSRVTSGGERGLLGMAFHPTYPADPRVYLSYTTTVDGELLSRVSEFRTIDAGDTLDPDSERVLFTVVQPAANHNGGHVAFGPHDGLLYVGMGDGGSGGDPWEPIGNGQQLTTLLGKILRIDVDDAAGGLPYRIPDGNPYAANAPCADGRGEQACPEIYAYGFRNPWRWSFDRVTGELWVGDVGQGEREEVDLVTAGGNYGWRCFEGTRPFNADCGPGAAESVPPLVEYDHGAGESITGGYVYRGEAFPALQGQYVFGDFVTGRLWQVPRTVTATRRVTAAEATATALGISSFAEGVDGELLAVDYFTGTLHHVVALER
jgi:glucose/arabinose dehydrogenase